MNEGSNPLSFKYAKLKKQLRRDYCVNEGVKMLKADPAANGKAVVDNWKHSGKGKRTVQVDGVDAFVRSCPALSRDSYCPRRRRSLVSIFDFWPTFSLPAATRAGARRRCVLLQALLTLRSTDSAGQAAGRLRIRPRVFHRSSGPVRAT